MDTSPTQPTPAPPRSVVIIPTFNEADNIQAVLEQVHALPDAMHILVIDDGSPDGTAAYVEEFMSDYPEDVSLIKREGKLGLGSAYVRGFHWALDHDYTFICEMDADLSHNPLDLPRLVEPIRDGTVDMTVGSRYVEGVRVMNWPLSRLVLSYRAGVYTRLITRLPIFDVTAGFVCYHRRILESIELDRVKSNGYSFQVEMKYRAWKSDFRIAEVPIVFTERTEGQSKMSRAIVREAAFKVWELRLREMLGRL